MSVSRSELRLSLEGLNCAQCSARIEESVRLLPGVSFAALDLVAGRLRVVLSGEHNGDETLSRIRGIVDSIEPGVSVSEEGAQAKSVSLPLKEIARLSAGVLLCCAMFAEVSEGVRMAPYVAATLRASTCCVPGNLRQGESLTSSSLMIATGGRSHRRAFGGVAVMLMSRGTLQVYGDEISTLHSLADGYPS